LFHDTQFYSNEGRKKHLRIEEKCNDEGKKHCGKNRETMKRQKLKKNEGYVSERTRKGKGGVRAKMLRTLQIIKRDKKRKERDSRLLSYKYKCVV
jgi:hypothetical protein